MPRLVMKIRFPVKDINDWAARYSYPRSDQHLTGKLRQAVEQQGHFTKAQLFTVCRWKSPRAAPKAEKNEEAFVKAVTAVSIKTNDERLRIEVLTLLDGVSWPLALVLLHFGISDDYPILDIRALWSLQCEVQQHQYDYELWREYVQYCRILAKEVGVSVRTLDKALWQYSKSKQLGPATEG